MGRLCHSYPDSLRSVSLRSSPFDIGVGEVLGPICCADSDGFSRSFLAPEPRLRERLVSFIISHFAGIYSQVCNYEQTVIFLCSGIVERRRSRGRFDAGVGRGDGPIVKGGETQLKVRETELKGSRKTLRSVPNGV